MKKVRILLVLLHKYHNVRFKKLKKSTIFLPLIFKHVHPKCLSP